ncbi:SGNH hydrolase domain-containing protein [soil metagenome]
MILAQADSVSPAEGVQDHRPAPNTFRPDIEGLRAVAVVAVVLFHAEVPGIGGGYVGVDVFFVISGFLITGLLWREVSTTGSVRLRNFYGARMRRLLPASAAVGIITMIASALLLPPLRLPTVLYDGIASALYVGNYWFVLDHVNYFADLLTPSPFLHYWSLGVEEQFYLVWAPMMLGTAWLVRLVRKRRSALSRRPYLVLIGFVAIASFALSLVITYVVPALAFFSLPTRAWQLALGGLIALTAHQCQRLTPRTATLTGWTGLAMITLACLWFTPTTPFPGTAALLPTLGATLIIAAGCATPTHGCGHLLSQPAMRAIGRISYSWYLLHCPVLVLTPALLGHPLSLPQRLAAALLAAALAWLTTRYIENPLRFNPTIRNSPWRSLTLGTIATLTAVTVGLTLLNNIPTPTGTGPAAATITLTPYKPTNTNPADPANNDAANNDAATQNAAVQHAFTQIQTAVAAAVELDAVPANLTPPLDNLAAEQEDYTYGGCLRTPYEVGQPECVMGDATSTTTVALIGDSHAAMWTPAFKHLAEQQHWRLEMLAKEACPIMDVRVDGPFRRLIEALQHCEQWRAEILARLREAPPQLVVVSVWRGYGVDESMTGFEGYNSAWIESMTRLVRQLRDTGAQVLVLGPVPSPHANVPICLSGHLDDAAACSLSRTSAVDPSGIAAEAAATQAGGGDYADLTDLFCTSARCPVIVGNTLVYLDVSHLTLQYSRVLTPAIGALADRALAGN